MANQAFFELCSKVYNNTATVEELSEFKKAMEVIAQKGASPQAIWELNEIIIKQAQAILTNSFEMLIMRLYFRIS